MQESNSDVTSLYQIFSVRRTHYYKEHTSVIFFVSVLLPSATRLTHAAFQPPEREPAVGVKEGREAPLSTALFSVSLKQ